MPPELALLVSQHMSTADMLQARAACTDWRSAFQQVPAALVPLTMDAELLDSFPGATCLDLLSRGASRRLTPDSIGLPASFKRLTSLMVSGATLTDSMADQALHAVQRCTGLEALVLRKFRVDENQQMVPAALAAAASLPRLRQLKLHCMWLPTMSFTALQPCTLLHELTLEGGQTTSPTAVTAPPVHSPIPQPAASFLAVVCQSLLSPVTLHAGMNSLEDGDAALQSLCEACPRLRKLSLQPHGPWRLRTYRPLAGLADLSDVVLHDVEAEDAALEDIGHGCPHLTKLHFIGCDA